MRLTVMRFACLFSILAVVGCGEPRRPAVPAPTSRAPAPTSAAQSPSSLAPTQAASPVASTRVAVTGVLLRRGETIEVCPGVGVGPCAGIRVEGAIESAALSEPGKVSVWRLTGAYDGTTLVLDAPAQATTLASPPDYRNACPELQVVFEVEDREGGNPESSVIEQMEVLEREHAARIAGKWWDRERQTMVLWVTGDPSALRKQIAQRARDARICIHGHARFSQAQLERLRAKADGILAARGVVWSSSSGDVVRNQIVYEADAIDAATLTQLAREVGGAVRVAAFIELLAPDLELARLPVPAQRGDVALLTGKSRGGARMSALGIFQVHYDPALRCVYLGSPEERVLPVWPFGYWATSSPLQIFDYDDNVVARPGEAVRFGGGHVDLQHVQTANTCGATSAFIGAPEPEPAPAQRRSPR
jgi:hypothetical protein